MILFWFFLALLLLCPRCKYLTAPNRQAGWPAAWATSWFQLKAFTSVVLWLFPSIANSLCCVSSCCFLACLFEGRIGEFPWFPMKRALPLQQAAFPLCLIHKESSQQQHDCFHWLLSLWVEQNYQRRKNTNFLFTLLTLPQSNVRRAIFFEGINNLSQPQECDRRGCWNQLLTQIDMFFTPKKNFCLVFSLGLLQHVLSCTLLQFWKDNDYCFHMKLQVCTTLKVFRIRQSTTGKQRSNVNT